MTHLKRGKMTSYDRRWLERQYAGHMQHEGGTGVSPEQVKFAKVWLKGVLDGLAKPPGKMSLSAVARRSGVHRNNITDWLNLKAFPRAETLKRFCDNLGLDYSVPAQILGWAPGGPESEETPTSLDGKLKRVDAILRMKSLTNEQRARYEAMRAGYESAYERMIDSIIEDFERDSGSAHTNQDDDQ